MNMLAKLIAVFITGRALSRLGEDLIFRGYKLLYLGEGFGSVERVFFGWKEDEDPTSLVENYLIILEQGNMEREFEFNETGLEYNSGMPEGLQFFEDFSFSKEIEKYPNGYRKNYIALTKEDNLILLVEEKREDVISWEWAKLPI